MHTFLVVLYVLVCLFLILVVLLQQGKGADLSVFGGGSTSVFGSTGAGGLLVKITAACGAIFLCTSLVYNYMTGSSQRAAKSIMMDAPSVSGEAPKPASQPEAAKAPVQFEETKPAAPVVDPLAPQGAAKN